MAFPYKTVLMVGATSGIGAAMSSRIIDSNSSAHVIAVGRRADNLAELQKKHGADRISTMKIDIAKLEELEGFVQEVTTTHPDLDCVFLNAGMQRAFNFARPSTFALSQIDAEMLTNFTSFVHLTYHFTPFLTAASGSGKPVSLIYTTSNLAVVPIPRCPGYSASKAALHAFVLCLRQQLVAHPNVKVIELMPPAVQTELHDEKHQPDIKDGGQMGMPLEQFTDVAYEGLVRAGGDQGEKGAEKMTRERVLIGGMPGMDENEKWREQSVARMWEAIVKMGWGLDGTTT